jgi:hypothetical protein
MLGCSDCSVQRLREFVLKFITFSFYLLPLSGLLVLGFANSCFRSPFGLLISYCALLARNQRAGIISKNLQILLASPLTLHRVRILLSCVMALSCVFKKIRIVKKTSVNSVLVEG